MDSTSYCVSARDILSGSRFDLNTYNDGVPDEYALLVKSNHISYQENSNFILTVYWNPLDVQVFDPSKTDGSHNLAQFNVPADFGTGVAFPLNIPCYLVGAYYGDIKKFSIADNSFLG